MLRKKGNRNGDALDQPNPKLSHEMRCWDISSRALDLGVSTDRAPVSSPKELSPETCVRELTYKYRN